MKIGLEGRKALVAGATGVLADGLLRALRDNGAEATTSPAEGAGAEIVVVVSAGAESGPVADNVATREAEDEAFAELARTHGPRARRLIHVISVAAVVPIRGAAKFSARQAGLASLTQALAMELAPACLVNAIAVGGFGVGAERFVSHSALRRQAALDEIVSAALFLANPQNTYTTGHVMTVDGGWSAGYARNF